LLFITFFFFNHTPPTEIYTLSLHDALPISGVEEECSIAPFVKLFSVEPERGQNNRAADRAPEFVANELRHLKRCAVPINVLARADRKSTRLNSSHRTISYAVFCLKKKKNNR